MAQLVAHLHGMQGVRGSSPLRSTKTPDEREVLRGSFREKMPLRPISEYLQLSKETIYHWRLEGTGPKATKLGKHLRYSRANVEAW